MLTKFGLAGIDLRGHLEEEKISIFYFGTEIQNGRHTFLVLKI